MLEGLIFVPVILQRLECKIYFAKAGVQNLFCKGRSAKFILQRHWQFFYKTNLTPSRQAAKNKTPLPEAPLREIKLTQTGITRYLAHIPSVYLCVPQ